MASWQSRIVRLYLNYLKSTTDWDAPIEKLRHALDVAAPSGALSKSVQTQPILIEHLRAEWLLPAQANTTAAVLYLHGGYATGSIKFYRTLPGELPKQGIFARC